MVAQQIVAALPYAVADIGKTQDKYGNRMTVVVPVTGINGLTVDVITGWIYDDIDAGKSIVKTGIKTSPRMTTAYVNPKSRST